MAAIPNRSSMSRGGLPPRQQESSSIKYATRARSGCLNCRKRRKKCDERQPRCSRCQRLKDDCRWHPDMCFRISGIETGHPSMLQALSQSGGGSPTLKIVDVSFSPRGTKRTRRLTTGMGRQADSNGAEEQTIVRSASEQRLGRNNDSSAMVEDSPSGSVSRVSSNGQGMETDWTHAQQLPAPAKEGTFHDKDQPRAGYLTMVLGPDQGNAYHEHHGAPSLSPAQPSPHLSMAMTSSRTPPVTNASISTSSPGFDGLDLQVLDYLTTHPANFDLLTETPRGESIVASKEARIYRHQFGSFTTEPVAESPPDLYMAYYPDAAYKELHSQLHNHILETARDVALTTHKPSQPSLGISPQSLHSPASSHLHAPGYTSHSANRHGLLVTAHITEKRAIELWQNYLDEVALWLDMFDNSKHWQTTVAHMAYRVPCLQYSLLALSARQQERKSPGRPHTESLRLYQEAIRLLSVQLPTLSTEIIAAVVLLCVLEMMSSSPHAWSKHLDGCAMLLKAAGINGVVGGVRESLFWTFARMDVYKAFISDTVTNLPTNRWFVSTSSMSDAVRLLKGRPGSDSYANYAVFLCAGVVNILSTRQSLGAESDHDSTATFASRWRALYDLLEGWYNDRPEEMKPLMQISPPLGTTESPFDTILYSTPPGISGSQLYHASVILLLQEKPKATRIPRTHKSMLWHARQICGISLSNHDHGALVNALQPIWIAGKLMSHHSEHRVILDLLKRLEESTGWATSWRIDDLKDFWGICEENN